MEVLVHSELMPFCRSHGHLGPGVPTTNNGLESINKVTKELLTGPNKVRLPLVETMKKACAVVEWYSHNSRVPASVFDYEKALTDPAVTRCDHSCMHCSCIMSVPVACYQQVSRTIQVTARFLYSLDQQPEPVFPLRLVCVLCTGNLYAFSYRLFFSIHRVVLMIMQNIQGAHSIREGPAIPC